MKRIHKLALTLVSALWAGLQPAQAGLAPLYQETYSGDLNGTQTLTLSTSGTVSGGIYQSITPGGTWLGGDDDAMLLNIAAGKRLTGISVEYMANATVGYARLNIVFGAILQGEWFFDDLQNLVGNGQGTLFDNGFGHLYNLPLTQADLGGADGAIELIIGTGYPTYTAGSSPRDSVGMLFNYTLTFTVEDVPTTTVPEPASPALLLGGLSACWLVTRRRGSSR